MKKRISFLLVLVLMLSMLIPALSMVTFAEEGTTGETDASETITISYIKDSNTLNYTTSLDTTAYSGGKQTVKKGEKFTLPTTSNTTNATAEGFQLVWYTTEGRTYLAGEEVSFEEDTRLYRVAAKKCYTAAELGTALTNDTKAAILMSDIEAASGISFPSWSTGIIILNGFNINFNTNSNGLIGEQRTQRHIYGEGTINVTNPDGKVGAHYFLKATNHGYAGDNSRTVIGRDVTVNAPNHYLTGDESGDIVNRYVWTRIYGTINCYGLFYRTASNNCGAYTEFYDTCNVTITGPRLIWDANSNGKFNYLGADIAIYGGTFYLPADAANESFWTNDNVETIAHYDGSKTYTNVGLTQLNKDNIKIYGGSFVTADGSVPAIAGYIANTYTGAWKTGGSGIISNKDTSTYEIPYLIRCGIKLVFTTYSDSALGTITVTDNVGSALAGKTFKYRVNTITEDSVTSYEIVVYESRMDGETEVWDVVSDELAIKYGNGGTILVSYDKTREALELYGFEANNAVYQTVVPATCEHSFTGAPVAATCQEKAYADYNCSKCKYNVYFSWGEKADHAYETTATVAPTASTLGSTSFTCATCKETKTYATTQNPTAFDVTVTIRNDDGTFETVTVVASDIFEFSTIGGNGAYIYTLSGIKAFGSYSIRNIYGAVIPNGILYVNIATQNYEKYEGVEYGLNVLETAENATITFQNIGNLSMVNTIKAGKGSNIIFEPNSTYYNPTGEKRSCSKLAKVDFSAGDLYVKVMSSAFQDRPITSLLLGENSTYDFQYQSFRNIKITELVIPQTATLTLGSNSFHDADLTSLTFPNGTPENIKQWTIGSESFRGNPITKITFGEYGTYSLGNNTFYSTKITEIKLAANSTYTIGSGCFSGTQVTIFDASAGNMTVTVNDGGLKNLTAITEFKLGENSTYTFNGKSVGTTSFTKLVIPKGSKVTFNDNWLESNTTFKEVDASADDVTLVFNTRAFNGRSIFDTIKLGKNANVTFNEDCFKGTAVQGLTFPEGATITINGNSMRNFAITELKFPKNATITFASNSLKDSTIESIEFSEYSTITFNNGSFNYSSVVKEIVIPANSTCLFKDWMLNSNSTIQKIDLSADNITATFNSHALRGSKALTSLIINGKNGSYIFNSESVRDVAGITELVLGEGSTYEFKQNSFYNASNITKVDASANNVTAIFGRDVFSGRQLTSLAFGKNSNYTIDYRAFYNTTPTNDIVFYSSSTFTIGQQAFYGADFASITFEDNCNVTFTGTEAFKECDKATSLYIGKNIAITNYPFKNLKALEKIVIMDGVTHASDYEFENAGAADIATPIVFYNHSYDLTFTKGMFNNCDGIVIYTVTDNIGTRTDVFVNCQDVKDADSNLLYKAWTVYLGIPHPLVEGHISNPTCTEDGITGWVSDKLYCDCDFKITETKTVNKYENAHNIKDTTTVADSVIYAVVVAPKLGHDYNTDELVVLDWIYVNNNFFANAKYQHKCQVCEAIYLGQDVEGTALFTMKGISVEEGEASSSLSHTIRVNLTAVDKYNEFRGENDQIKYGMLAGIVKSGTNGKVLNADCTPVAEETIVSSRYDGTNYSLMQVKISNITDPDEALYCCAFTVVGEDVYYLLNDNVTDAATPVSVNEPNGVEADAPTVTNVNVEAVVDNKEKVYA